MKYYFLLGAFVISSGIYAQELFHNHLRFWSKEGIIEKQMEQNRKKAKIKKAYVYKASENWEVTDSAQPQYIFEYDSEGRVTIYTQFLGAGDTYYQHTTDSFLYDKKGNLKEYSVTDTRDGKVRYFYRASAETTATGQLEKMHFSSSNKENVYSNHTYVFEYDSLERKKVVRAISINGDEHNTWKIEYGKNNRVKKIIFNTYWGAYQIYEPLYNKKGFLTTYVKHTSLEQNWRSDTVTYTYSYDAQNRLEKRKDETAKEQDYPKPHGCQYWYKDNAIVPYRMLDEYERNLSGVHYIKDHLVYKFEYYK